MISAITPASSRLRLLRLLARVALWALRLVAGLWLVLILLWAGLHLVIVPRIELAGSALETWAQRSLGATVKIENLAMHSGSDWSLLPALELRGVILEFAEHQSLELLELSRAVITVSPRSLMRLGVEQIYLEAPRLRLRMRTDDSISDSDSASDSDSESDSSWLLEWLLAQPEIALIGGELMLNKSQHQQQSPQRWSNIDLVIRAKGRKHFLRLDGFSENDRLHIAGILKEPLLWRGGATWDTWSGQWYGEIELNDPQNTTQNTTQNTNLALARQLLPSDLLLPSEIQGHSRLWIDMHSGKATNLQAQTELKKLFFQDGTGLEILKNPKNLNVNLDFSFVTKLGKAQIHLPDYIPEGSGKIFVPSVFEQPEIALDSLQMQIAFSIPAQDQEAEFRLEKAIFANADAKGSAEGLWQPSARVFKLNGVLERARATAVARYLPLVIPQDVRDYVGASILDGQAQNVLFEFDWDKLNIRAPVTGVKYDYVPFVNEETAKGLDVWPPLHDLSGTLIFTERGMQVINASASMKNVQFARIDAEIADWNDDDDNIPTVQISAEGSNALPAWLDTVRGSAIEKITHSALTPMRTQGNARLGLELEIPIPDPEQSRVRGVLDLQGNRLELHESAPMLSEVRGQIRFTQSSLEAKNLDAQALGGAVVLSASTNVSTDTYANNPYLNIEAKGKASAEGLRQDAPLEWLRQLAHHASGSADYELEIAIPLSGQHLNPALKIRSDLEGMALNLPAPLGKSAGNAQALRLNYLPDSEKNTSEKNSKENLDWVEISTPSETLVRYGLDPRTHQAVRGWIGQKNDKDEKDAIHWALNLEHLNLDAWLEFFEQDQSDYEPVAPTIENLFSLLPQTVKLNTKTLQWRERRFENLMADISRQGGRWRAQIQAPALDGYIDYQPEHGYSPAGLVLVRLEHLRIPASVSKSADGQDDHESTNVDTSSTWPALDIQVRELEVEGKNLGELLVFARAGQQRWELERFELNAPEARWRSSGYWEPRGNRTELEFSLNLRDTGKLLERLGMPEVLRSGHGSASGHLLWSGSPIQPKWQSAHGEVRLEVQKGAFLKADPGAAKLLGVLSLQSLGRRLSGDFRDVFSSGFAFDALRGEAEIHSGIASTENLTMRGANAVVLLTGEANLDTQTQDLRVVITPAIDAMTASLFASAINPAVGLGSFLAQAILRRPAMKAATRSFEIRGSWEQPLIEENR